VGRYRLWRDLGYVVGALMAGLLTDWLGFQSTLVIIALLLVGSGVLARVCLPAPAPSQNVSLGEPSVAV
jgi:predicted MFS family arabinose efflux permease